MKRATRVTPDLDYRYGWIGVADAMRYLGLRRTKTRQPSALYRLINEHNLPHGRMGRLYRFRRADLDAWLQINQEALAAVGQGADRSAAALGA